MKEIKMEMDVTPDEEKDIVSMLVREELNCTTLAKNALSPLIKETWTRQSRAAALLLAKFRKGLRKGKLV